MDQQTPEDRIYLDLGRGEASDIMEDLPLGQSVSEATRRFYIQLRTALRRPTPVVPKPREPADDDDVEYAPMQPIRPTPETLPRRGYIVRKRDVTGISGLGVIAEFCVFSDDAVAWRWLGGPPQDQPKFEIYDKSGVDPFLQISGHNGNTEIVWIDELEAATEEAPLAP
jgi:hypothetical protein